MKSRIGYKLIVALILFSSLITLVTTAFQLYVDYRADIKRVTNYETLVRESYLNSLATNVWLYNDKQIQIQLQGILHLQDMEYIHIQSEEGANWEFGSVQSKRNLTKAFPLLYKHKGDMLNIGVLTTVVSLDNIYKRLFKKMFAILLSNAVKTFLVSGFILLIFQYLVTRHLYSLSNWLRNLDIGQSFENFKLDRNTGKSNKNDELDEVVIAINEMQNNLKKYLHDLVKSEKKYRSLFENAVMGIFQSTPEGRLLSANPAFAKIHGYASSEEIIKEVTDIGTQLYADPADRLRYQHILQKSGHVENFVHKAIRKDGSQIWVSNFTRADFDQEGKVIQYEGTITDITDRKTAEKERSKLKAQLQQLQKMESIGTLAGGIAHDFNNILYPLIGFAEMIQDDLPPDSLEQDNISEVLKSALRAKDLVKQILMYSRQSELELRPIELKPIIEEAMRLLKSSIPTTIDIQADIDPDCGMVIADPTQIHQVIINLATNSYHAMQESGGQLTITLEQAEIESNPSVFPHTLPGKYALIKVIDTGTGIKKGVLDRIFEPYFTTKEIGKGTGLGLSVVQGIVKSCHGDIHVYSEPGVGTEIRVYLPELNESTELKHPERSGPVQGGTERLLLVDDEEAIVKMEKLLLERLGYHVTICFGSKEALDVFKADPDAFDLVISDMTMPDMTGLQLASKLREINPHIPVIICTGFSDLMTDDIIKKADIQAVVIKPVIRKKIADTIREVLREGKNTGTS